MVQAGAGVVVGLGCKLYRNTANHASPTWNEVTLTQDLTLSLSRTLAEVKARGSIFNQGLPTLISAPLSFSILGDTSVSNDDYDTLRDAFIATGGTVLDLAIAEAAIATSGTEYFRADYILTKFERKEPLEGVASVDIEAQLAYTTTQNVPAWAAGS